VLTPILFTKPPLAVGEGLSYVELLFNLLTSENVPLESFGPERELVFAFGEDEILATYGEDQTLKFENMDHLASLNPENYLTFRLFANNDAANVLWEYAFSSGLQGQSDVRVVSVDDNIIPLTAYLPLEIDEEDLKNVTVGWEVSGGGSVEQSVIESNFDVRTCKITQQGAGLLFACVSLSVGGGCTGSSLGECGMSWGE
jgi:hypothetical protein